MVWSRPPHAPRAVAGEVHVWSFGLDLEPAELEALAGSLSSEERARASRFHFEIHRNFLVARRGILRAILARYLDASPAELIFDEGEWGKPFLAGAADLRFNVSDSEDRALIAVARGREVGVDIERIRPERMEKNLPERFFSPGEVAALRALPVEQQTRGFFNCWSRKEAYIKARGMGLHLALDSFDVSLAPGAPAALIATRPDSSDAGRWSMRALATPSGYAGALVVEGADWRLRCFGGAG